METNVRNVGDLNQDELPEWTDVYQGLSDTEVDDLDAAIHFRFG